MLTKILTIMKGFFNINSNRICILILFFMSLAVFAQQDAQYTQYMYNTMSINPAYAGQRDVLSVMALYRTQWVGLDGAPETQSLGVHAPFKNDRMGWGLSIVNDVLGPTTETQFDGNFSYSIYFNDKALTELTFGIKAGLHLLNSDWTKGKFQFPDNAFQDNLDLKSPVIGAGIYLHNDSWYLGFSVPNFLTTKHFDEVTFSNAAERLHYYLIGGYVFELNPNLSFKPAFLVKTVSGAPLIVDVSANFLINEKLSLGVAYRWDDSVSALAGFQITPAIYVGYAFDYTTTNLTKYNNGSHEVLLRLELFRDNRFLSPRFF